jgi:hypothetical protein
MSEKNTLRTRLVNKHDIEANWLKATNFTPLQGELIVYDVDENCNYERIKMGDGVTNVNELPFISPQADWNQNDENAPDYVKNRTHYSGLQHITFTGDTDGLDVYNGYLYRVHSDTPNINDVIGGTMTVLVDGSYRDFTIAESWVKQLTAYPNDGYVINNSVIVFFNDVPNVAKAGIYFAWHQAICQVAGLSYNVRKTLDEKYIPDTIARKSDIPEIDPTLTIEGAAADAKAVGDLWNNIPTDADVWETLINIGLYERLADESGNVLTDEANAILLI